MRAFLQRFIKRFQPTRHTIDKLHAVVLLPTHRCNCRCVMCDYWKSGDNVDGITLNEVMRLKGSLKRFGSPWIILSGGEALLHLELWRICNNLKEWGCPISLLTNGVLVKPRAPEIVKYCNDVIVSLDGPEDVHDAIRGVSGAFAKLSDGVAALKTLDRDLEITGRCVLQKRNCLELPRIIDTALNMGLSHISFFPADVSPMAFQGDGSERDGLLPSPEDSAAFRQVLARTVTEYAREFRSKFIAESPKKIRAIARYFETGITAPVCNAPWISTVIEADGSVKPCFFHPPYGNLSESPLESIVNSEKAIAFRKSLNVKQNPICQRCVCPLYRP